MMGKAYRHLMRHEARDAQADVPAVSVASRRVALIIDLNGVIRVVRERVSRKICVIFPLTASGNDCGGRIRRLARPMQPRARRKSPTCPSLRRTSLVNWLERMTP